jgi:hypothetical protein
MRALFAHINVSQNDKNYESRLPWQQCSGMITGHRNLEKANEFIPNNAKRRHKSVWELCSQLCQVRNNINMIKLCFKNVDFAC